MTSPTIRLFNIKDTEALKVLFVEMEKHEQQFYSDRADPEKVKDTYVTNLITEIENVGVVLVAEVEGKVVGYIAGKEEVEIENNHNYFNVWDLSVLPDFRNKGIGTRLLEEIEIEAKKKGFVKIGIGVLVGNEIAYQLYKRLGFKDYGIDLIKDLK